MKAARQVTEHSPKLRAIEALVEGRLSEAGAARLERHLAGCSICEKVWHAAQGYRISVDELRALPTPALDWERIQAATLPANSGGARVSSSPPPVPRRGNVRALVYPVLALAAAVALALVSSRGGTPTAPVVEGPVTTKEAVVPVAAPQVGTVVAVMGAASVQPAVGAPSPLTPLAQVREGDRIEAADGSVVDVRLEDGSQLRLLSRGTVTATELRLGAVALTLHGGELQQRVAPVPAAGHYHVLAGSDRVQVVGTIFAVSRAEDESEVVVEEGRVQVDADGQSTVLYAGQRWTRAAGVTTDAEATVLRVPPAASAAALLEPPSASEPHVTAHLPAFPGARTVRVDGTQFPQAGALAMRLPTRDIELAVQLNDGRELKAVWHLTAEEPSLSLRQLRTLLFGPPVAAGNLSGEQLQQAVAPGRRGWQRCYERALRSDATLRPSVLLRIELNANGAVRRTRVTGDVAQSRALTQCIDQVARRLQFPHPGGPFSFEVPLSFRAR